MNINYFKFPQYIFFNEHFFFSILREKKLLNYVALFTLLSHATTNSDEKL